MRWKGSNINNPGPSPENAPALYPFKLTTCTAGGPRGTWYGPISPTNKAEVHSNGQNWLYADGHAKWRRMGGTGNSNYKKDPFDYNADGTVQSAWVDGCGRLWLFRPDLQAGEFD